MLFITTIITITITNLAGGLTVWGCDGGRLDRGHVGAQALFSAANQLDKDKRQKGRETKIKWTGGRGTDSLPNWETIVIWTTLSCGIRVWEYNLYGFTIKAHRVNVYEVDTHQLKDEFGIYMTLKDHLVPKSLSCAERLLPGLDGGLMENNLG